MQICYFGASVCRIDFEGRVYRLPKSYRLSPSYSNDASPYLIVKATTLPAICSAMTHNVNVGSRNGPNRTRIRVGSVKLVADLMALVVGSISIRVKPRIESRRSMRRVRSGGGFAKGTTEGNRVSVSGSYLLFFVSQIVADSNEDLPRNSMSRTWHKAKQLRTTEQEVGDLRYEEEEKGFRVVALDGDDGERHACKVAKGISGKCSSGVPSNSKHERHKIEIERDVRTSCER